MALSDMYTAKPGSPKTATTADIGTNATSIPVDDVSVFPSGTGNLPNLAVLGENENAEIILYREISGSSLTNVTRGMGSTTASAWPSGTAIARNFTSLDHDRFLENIKTLDSEKAPKANAALSGTPTAPTAAAGTNSTQIATTAFVASALSGKADSAHTHDASAITSGVLGTSYGGTGNQTGTATLATTTADTSNALYPVGVTSGATTALKRDTSITMNGGTVTATTFSGALSGNASTATTLETGRTIRTNLGSTTAVSFNGSSNVTPGVTGTLPIANGGTGATSTAGSTCAAAQLFPENVGTDATFFFTRTNSWANVGYTALSGVKTLLGLSDSGQQQIRSDTLAADNYIYYRKCNGVVQVWGDFQLASNAGSGYTTLVTLGSAYRPPAQIFTSAFCYSSTRDLNAAIRITSSGVISLVTKSTWYASDHIMFNTAFIVGL